MARLLENAHSIWHHFRQDQIPKISIDWQVDAVELIAMGTAPVLVQPEEGATYDPALNKKDLQQVYYTAITFQGYYSRTENKK